MPNTAEIDTFKDNGDGICVASVVIKNDAGEELGRVNVTDKADKIDQRIRDDVKKGYAQLITATDIDPVSRPSLGKKTFDLDAQGNMS